MSSYIIEKLACMNGTTGIHHANICFGQSWPHPDVVSVCLLQAAYGYLLGQVGDTLEVMPGEEFRVAVEEAGKVLSQTLLQLLLPICELCQTRSLPLATQHCCHDSATNAPPCSSDDSKAAAA